MLIAAERRGTGGCWLFLTPGPCGAKIGGKEHNTLSSNTVLDAAERLTQGAGLGFVVLHLAIVSLPSASIWHTISCFQT
jgi:hypothetical protein